MLGRLWFLGSADNGQLGVDLFTNTFTKNTLTVPHIRKLVMVAIVAKPICISTVTLTVSVEAVGRLAPQKANLTFA